MGEDDYGVGEWVLWIGMFFLVDTVTWWPRALGYLKKKE